MGVVRPVRRKASTFPALAAAFGAAAIASAARAEDLKVPRQFRTIEQAQAAARPGDRIVVSRGRHRGVVVHAPGVTVVGRGTARLQGVTYVAGDGAAVEGFRVDGVVSLTGTGNRAEGLRLRRGASIRAGGTGAEVVANVAERGAEVRVASEGALVTGNRLPLGTVSVEGPCATVEGNVADAIAVAGAAPHVCGNEVGTGGLEVVGAGALVEGNRAPESLIQVAGADVSVVGNAARGLAAGDSDRLLAEGNRVGGWGLHVGGDDAVVRGNEFVRESDVWAVAAVTVRGDGARVLSNDVRIDGTGVWTIGDGAEIAGNALDSGPAPGPGLGAFAESPAIVAAGAGAWVRDNSIRAGGASGVLVNGPGATVQSNDIRASGWTADGIRVVGDAALVVGNGYVAAEWIQGPGSGIVIDGSGALVTENEIDGAATDGIEIWNGADSVVLDCRVTGVGRCGVWIQNQASATEVTGVTSVVSLVGFMNLGEGTCLTGSSLTGNRCIDVLTGTELAEFTGCTFGTFSSDVFADPMFGVLGGGD